MSVLSPPTGHLTVYEASAEHIRRINETYAPNKIEGYFQPEPKQQAVFMQFRLLNCFLGRTWEELKRAICVVENMSQ